jgi:4-amino-4-deoxy-L-arabinose transferase-like glycosyltransferase
MVKRKDKKKHNVPKSSQLAWPANALLIVAIIAGLFFRYSLWQEMGKLPVEKDAALYCTMAQNIADHGVFSAETEVKGERPQPTAYTMPGYPMFLSLVYWILGGKPWPLKAIRLIQMILSLGLIIVAYYFGKFLYNKWAGVVNAFIMALYPANIFAPQMVLTECLSTVLMVTSMYFLLMSIRRGWEEKRKYIEGLAGGFTLAASFAIRPLLLALTPFLLGYFVVDYFVRKPKPSLKRLLQILAVVFAPFVILWSVWTIRNAVQFGHLIPLTTSSNNPKLLGLDYERKYVGNMFTIKGNEYEVNKQWGEWASAAFWQNMHERPKQYVKHLLAKVVPLLTIPFGATPAEGWEKMSWQGEYWFYRAHRFLFWLALIGIILLLSKRKEVWLVVALLAILTLTHIMYLATNRYGYPLLALMLNFVGVSAVRSCEAIAAIAKKKGWEKYVVISSVAIALGLLFFRCTFMFPWFARYLAVANLVAIGIVAFWIVYALRWVRQWKNKALVLLILTIFCLNFWGITKSFKVWGVAPERIHSFGYLYSTADVIEQIMDIPESLKQADAYYVEIASRRGSNNEPTYVYGIFANGVLVKEIGTDESVPQKLRIEIPSELVNQNKYLRVSLRLKGQVDVYTQYVLVNLRLNRSLGISLFNGQMEDLSYRKWKQKGTFEIGLVVRKGETETIWYGSPRKKLLAKLAKKE